MSLAETQRNTTEQQILQTNVTKMIIIQETGGRSRGLLPISQSRTWGVLLVSKCMHETKKRGPNWLLTS